RGPKTWLVRVYAGKTGSKRRYVNRTVHGTKRDAEAVRNKLLVDRDMDRLALPTKLTLSDYLEQWKEKALRGRVTPRTFDNYSQALARYIIPVLGDKRLTSVTAWDIQGIYSSLASRGLSGRTIGHTHVVLGNALR